MPEKGKSMETLVHCDADEQRFRYTWGWRRKTNRTINELMFFLQVLSKKKTRKDKNLFLSIMSFFDKFEKYHFTQF